jgi:type I restriction enzyme R subunit
MTPEERARLTDYQRLTAADWANQDLKQDGPPTALGSVLWELALSEGYGFADYLLFVDGNATGVNKAKKRGATFPNAEKQSADCAQSQLESLAALELCRFNPFAPVLALATPPL